MYANLLYIFIMEGTQYVDSSLHPPSFCTFLFSPFYLSSIYFLFLHLSIIYSLFLRDVFQGLSSAPPLFFLWGHQTALCVFFVLFCFVWVRWRKINVRLSFFHFFQQPFHIFSFTFLFIYLSSLTFLFRFCFVFFLYVLFSQSHRLYFAPCHVFYLSLHQRSIPPPSPLRTYRVPPFPAFISLELHGKRKLE